jgi:peroxiredoxin
MTISIGPLDLPLFVLVLLAAYLVALLALRFTVRSKEIRREVNDRATGALLAALIVWKLVPGVLDFRLVLETPLYLLYATGGSISFAAAAVAGVAWFLVTTRRWWGSAADDRAVRLRGVAVFFAVFIVVGVGGTLASSAGDGTTEASATAPDFTLYSLEGEELSLGDFRGTTIILNFWATWCPPCRAEMPLLVDFSRERGAEGPVVVSVNQTTSEASREVLEAFVDEYRIDFPVLLDPDNGVFIDYGVRSIPATFVIGPTGEILARRTGAVSREWLRRF